MSSIALGTVELGMEYGIASPGRGGRPSHVDGIALIHQAIEGGVNFFDTAPEYGESEALLGRALADVAAEVFVATKVGPYPQRHVDSSSIVNSLDRSLGKLERERLDIVQIHNATEDQLADSRLLEVLDEAKERRRIGAIGATVYSVSEAIAAIRNPRIDAIQVPFNILDQRMRKDVFPLAQERGAAVIVRSAFLKGALTSRRAALPERLAGLRRAADRVAEWAAGYDLSLEQAALRFCLGYPGVVSVLVGVSDRQELEHALATATAGGLPPEILAEAEGFDMGGDPLTDPRLWGIP